MADFVFGLLNIGYVLFTYLLTFERSFPLLMSMGHPLRMTSVSVGRPSQTALDELSPLPFVLPHYACFGMVYECIVRMHDISFDCFVNAGLST